MSRELNNKRIAFLVTCGVEQVEFTRPWEAVESAGGTPVLVSLKPGQIQGMHHLNQGDKFDVDEVVGSANPDDFDGLCLPGGLANPDSLRMNDDAVKFVRAFFEEHKPVAAICHGIQLLIEADVLKHRTVTSWPAIQTDVRNAGGRWVDEEVHTDNGLVTSRKPDDLDAFCAKMVEEFAEGTHVGQVAYSKA